MKTKEEIIAKFNSVSKKCGEFGSIVVNIGKAFDTGSDANGGTSTHEEEMGALAQLALILEKEGHGMVGVELMLIAKDIKEYSGK